MKMQLPGSVDTMASNRPFCDVMATISSSKGLRDDLVITRLSRRQKPKQQENFKIPEDQKKPKLPTINEKRQPQRQSTIKKHKPISIRPRQLKKGSINNGATNSSSVGATMTPKQGTLDANVYATKKTIAQGLLDVALLTANASQLKYLLQAGSEHEFYYVMMVLIILSIILQVAFGCIAILKGRRDINVEAQQRQADFLNNLAVWVVFISLVVQVFLSVFTITPRTQPPFYWDNTSNNSSNMSSTPSPS